MEKRKIGLILVPEHTNYGAQLQSYAIQQVVEALGCDTEIILYQSDGHRHIKFCWGLIPWYISNFLKSKPDGRYKNLDEIVDFFRLCIDHPFVNRSMIEVNGGYSYK